MCDILKEASKVSLSKQARQSLSDVIEEAERVSQEVHRAEYLGSLALQFLRVVDAYGLEHQGTRLKHMHAHKRVWSIARNIEIDTKTTTSL